MLSYFFHTTLMVLVLGHTRIWQVCIPCVLVPSQQNLLVETWIHFLSSLHSRKQFLHPFGELFTHFVLPWKVKCGWYPILLRGRMFLHNQLLLLVHSPSPQALLCVCQVSYMICICSCIPTCNQLVWFHPKGQPASRFYS